MTKTQKDLLTAAAAAVVVFVIARQLIARKAIAQTYGVTTGSDQARMLAEQEEGLW